MPGACSQPTPGSGVFLQTRLLLVTRLFILGLTSPPDEYLKKIHKCSLVGPLVWPLGLQKLPPLTRNDRCVFSVQLTQVLHYDVIMTGLSS